MISQYKSVRLDVIAQTCDDRFEQHTLVTHSTSSSPDLCLTCHNAYLSPFKIM